MNQRINVIGVDLAKEVFQLHAADFNGRKIWSKKLSRKNFIEFWNNLEPCEVGMEACNSSHYWGRKLTKLGFKVKLIAPQFVKPFVKTNKSDAADAEAIVEALQRPNMRFVEIKTEEQQSIQMLHRIRQRQVRGRTKVINEIRGFLREFGIIIPKSVSSFREQISSILEEAENGLLESVRTSIQDLYEEYKAIHESILNLDRRIDQVHKQNEVCRRLSKVEGIGELTATALYAKFGNASSIKNGRGLAACLGLVPKHSGTGGKTVNLKLSKRGDPYIRSLMIHGARSVLQAASKRNDAYSERLKKKKERGHFNKTCAAIASRNARVAWIILNKGVEYQKVWK